MLDFQCCFSRSKWEPVTSLWNYKLLCWLQSGIFFEHCRALTDRCGVPMLHAVCMCRTIHCCFPALKRSIFKVVSPGLSGKAPSCRVCFCWDAATRFTPTSGHTHQQLDFNFNGMNFKIITFRHNSLPRLWFVAPKLKSNKERCFLGEHVFNLTLGNLVFSHFGLMAWINWKMVYLNLPWLHVSSFKSCFFVVRLGWSRSLMALSYKREKEIHFIILTYAASPPAKTEVAENV